MTSDELTLVGSIAAARAAGISLRQLYYWVDILHVVQPQVRQHGLRRFRHFTAADVQRLQMLRRLLEEGYTLQAAARQTRAGEGHP